MIVGRLIALHFHVSTMDSRSDIVYCWLAFGQREGVMLLYRSCFVEVLVAKNSRGQGSAGFFQANVRA